MIRINKLMLVMSIIRDFGELSMSRVAKRVKKNKDVLQGLPEEN
jgi:hypothetical protein